MSPEHKLPRKLLTGQGPEERELRTAFNQWKVDPYCRLLWASNRVRGRGDTFIGLLDTRSWTLYIAPCFGVKPAEWQRKLHLDATEPATPLRTRFAVLRDLPDNLAIVSGSTSVEADAARTLTLSEIRPIYGPGACLVPWTDHRGFDGHSHRVMGLWVENNPNISPKPGEHWQATALGFAIQRDKEGYYVRFASGYNQWPWGSPQGGDVNIRFAKRSSHGKLLGYDQDHELRDLPKEWAMKLVEVLARDLHLGNFQRPSPLEYSEPYFGKLVSRGEHALTKYKRLT